MYGDGLFETLRVCGGRPFHLAQHLERMMRGADFLKIKCQFTSGEMEQFAGQLIEQNQMPEAVLRVTLTRGPGGRGYTPQADGQPTVVMTLHAAPGTPASGTARPIDRCLKPCRRPALQASGNSSRHLIAFWRAIRCRLFKTTSKLIHVMARREAVEKGADEALLLNTNGEVAETAGGNLFWIGDGTNLHRAHGLRRAARHHARGRSGNLPDARPAGEPTCHQTRGVEKLRGHFHHPERARHRAGGRRWTASRSRCRRWWSPFRAPMLKCSRRREFADDG